MNADQLACVDRLKTIGLTWGQAQDLAERFHPSVINQQIDWLPLRAEVRDPKAFVIAAIEKSFPAPTMETAAVARGVDYAKIFSAGYRLTIEQKKYYDNASELHTQVVTALEAMPDFEQAQHMRHATDMALHRWPQLEKTSRSFPMALDRALAERLKIDLHGVATRLIMPPAPFDEVDYRDPNRKLAQPAAVTAIAPRPTPGTGPKKLGQLIPITPRVVRDTPAACEQNVESVDKLDALDLPAYEDVGAPV